MFKYNNKISNNIYYVITNILWMDSVFTWKLPLIFFPTEKINNKFWEFLKHVFPRLYCLYTHKRSFPLWSYDV